MLDYLMDRKKFPLCFDRRKCLGYNRAEESASQKNRVKKLVFRIFCELLAKTGLESRINTGFVRGYRRNDISPFRALTHRHLLDCCKCVVGRNDISPFRALTQ